MKYYNYEIENGVLKMVTEGSQGDYPSTIIDILQLPPVTKDKNGRVVIHLPRPCSVGNEAASSVEPGR